MLKTKYSLKIKMEIEDYDTKGKYFKFVFDSFVGARGIFTDAKGKRFVGIRGEYIWRPTKAKNRFLFQALPIKNRFLDNVATFGKVYPYGFFSLC